MEKYKTIEVYGFIISSVSIDLLEYEYVKFVDAFVTDIDKANELIYFLKKKSILTSQAKYVSCVNENYSLNGKSVEIAKTYLQVLRSKKLKRIIE